MIKCACKQIYRGNMPVTELYAFNLICENLLAALYGVALKIIVYIYTLFRRYVYLLDHHSCKIVFLLNSKRIPPVKRIKKRFRINFLNTSVNKHQLFFKLIFRAVELTYSILNISKKKFCRQSFPYLLMI